MQIVLTGQMGMLELDISKLGAGIYVFRVIENGKIKQIGRITKE